MWTRDPDSRRLTRREALLLGVGAFAVASVPFLRRRRQVRRSIPVMGTVADLVVVHPNVLYAQAALTAAADELRRVDTLMTRFRAESDIGRLNQTGTKAVTVQPETAWVLRAALRWADATDGVFDPCLARLTSAHDDGAGPADEMVARLASRRLYRALELDDTRAWLTTPEAAVDLGGIAKGYGVDRAVAVLRSWGITDGLVNAGGDLYALGRSPEGDPWHVAVRSPTGAGTIAEFSLEDAAAATSGDYLRPGHLLNPATGRPITGSTRSLTVVADHCVEADAAATAAFGLSPLSAAAAIQRGCAGARVVNRA